MNSISTKSFRRNLRIMKLLNLYPPEKVTVLFKVKAYFVFSVLIPPIPILGFLYLYYDQNFTIDQLGENAFVIAEMACSVTKFLPFITNGTKIKQCIHYFEFRKFEMRRKKHKQIIDKYCWICRTVSLVFLVGIIAGFTFFAVRPAFGGKQKLPFDVWLPFSPTENLKFFTGVYVFIVSGVGYAAIACAAIDPLIGGLACLAIGQLEVLKDNLQNLNEYAQESLNKEIEDYSNKFTRTQIIKHLINQCVCHHNAILKFIHQYKDCFSSSVFSQFAGSILVICSCCFQLSKLQPLSFNFISMFTFTCLVLFQIYIYCHCGTLLFEQSYSVTEAVYMGTWYECDVEIRKALIILMERSKNPVTVTAGTIFNISIDTFTMILRRSYSLLAVLKNF